jgi:hypothetical protein
MKPQKILLTLSFSLFMLSLSLAQVEFYGISKPKSFVIIKDGTPINKIPPVGFIKNYVEKKIADWQKKGEFEKSSDYQIRVTEPARNQKVQEFTDEAVKTYKTEYAKTMDWNVLQLSQYDADNETFLIKSDQFGDFAIPIPISEAQALKQNWNSVQFKDIDFNISGNILTLTKITLINPANEKPYLYDSKKSTTYAANNITYNFAPIQVDLPTDIITSSNTILENKTTSAGRDSVDFYIPDSAPNVVNDMSFVLAIGNENYKNEINVPFAKNDASVFAEYCKKTLRIPQNNVRLLINGTYGQMLGEIKWINDVIKAYNGEARVIIYYAGHGIPDEKDKSAFLLPTDGSSNIPQTALRLDDLYAGFTNFPSKSVSVFLDACFSGGAREGSLAEGRGVKVRPKENILPGNLLVFSATSADETALPVKERAHGLFTYYILKKLQDSKGEVYMSDLVYFVTDNVGKQSIVVNNKSQNPKIYVSPSIQDSWQKLKLK